MLRRSLLLALSLTLLAVVPAQAGLGRYLGCGWGDGYHAKNACAGYPAACHAGAPQSPWWMPSSGPFGPSLFRQPGEGSSVIVTDKAVGP